MLPQMDQYKENGQIPRRYHNVLDLGTDLTKYGQFRRDYLSLNRDLYDLVRKKGASCLRYIFEVHVLVIIWKILARP